uniref:Presenilin n=1 Tax=Chloropicon laureae TaxID=464258 RepID=A0A7S2Z289_9CHLO
MDVDAENGPQLEESVLASLGAEVTSIVAPVSACMALTVCLVRTLYLGRTDLSTAPTSIATAIYHESASDDTGTKVTGALLNALVFVAAITIMTFIMFLLFKYNCTKCLYGYMAFSSFTLLFFMGGYFVQAILEKLQVPFDALSFIFLLFNSAVVGTISMWTAWTPFVLKQAYLVLVAVVIAVLFTRIPAWTTWFLLGALVIYDLCAVLLPGGPLKALVELAVERNEAIPALVYESRLAPQQEPDPRQSQSLIEGGEREQRRGQGAQVPPREEMMRREEEAGQGTPVPSSASDTVSPGVSPEEEERAGAEGTERGETSQSEPLLDKQSSSSAQPSQAPPGQIVEEAEFELPDSIKLGLGDFIFYSVLVGQASLYDMTTVYVCYLAIMAGLGATLILLAIYQKALPALPISITLGVVFYFMTRFFLDPTVVPLSVTLLFL